MHRAASGGYAGDNERDDEVSVAGKRKADGATDTLGGWWRARRAAKQKTAKARGRTPKTWKSRLWRATKWITATGLVLVLAAVAVFVYLYKTIDIPAPNAEFLTETSFVYYDDGKTEVGRFATQFRDSIALDEMPDSIKDAVVAAENRTFYTDKGLDPKGILRAAFSNASGGATQGASTITQQYVKILYLNQERSYKRKVKEAILSLKIQRTKSKNEILEGYLNTIYFGRGAYGIEAAAQSFFNKHAADLTLRESAVLACVINNPTRFDPSGGKDARRALEERFDYVLDGMADAGDITSEEADKAERQGLPTFPKIQAESAYGGQRGHLLTMVKDQLLKTKDKDGNFFTEQQIDGGGLRITTTFTPRAMNAARLGVEEIKPTKFPGAKQLHVAAASVEPGTGALRGLYAGQSYLDSQLNWAVEGGQAGSTFKPFALAAGLEDGFALKDTFQGNSPYVFPDGSEVENEGDAQEGAAISLTTALEDSVNTAFIDLSESMDDGPDRIVETANKMGIPPEKPDKEIGGIPATTPGLEANATVSLGSQTVSPINMANGYATIANEGVAAQPFFIKKVEDADGETLYEHKVADRRAISADIASDVSYAMQRVVQYGTGTVALGLDRSAAGKTGTATKTGGAVSSSWFAGFTPQLSTAVMYVRGPGNGQLDGWVPTSSDGREGYFGGNYPAKTWTAIMNRDMEGLEEIPFPEPALVDGEAPSTGHSYTPPPVTTQPPPTRRPPRTPSPSDEPSTDPTTPTEPPTSDPPTSDPPTSDPPTSDPPASPPTLLPSPSQSAGGEPPSPGRQRESAPSAVATRETSARTASWSGLWSLAWP